MDNKRALFFILLTLFIDAVGVGITFPMMPALMERVGAENLASGAIWAGLLMSIYAGAQFLFGPAVGALSDAIGRKPVLIAAMAVLALDYLIMATTSSYWLLFAARFTAGMAGATYVTATAYLADISPPDQRAARFGLVGAVFGLGFVLGPAIGGLLSTISVSAPFWVAAAVSAGNALLGIWVLRESLDKGKRRKVTRSDLNPFSAITAALRLPGVGVFLVVLAVFEFANMVYPTLWAFWGAARFGWDILMIGVSLGAYGLGVALVQALVLPPLVARLGEGRVAMIGLVTGAVAAALFGVVAAPIVVFALIPFACLSDMLPASLTGLMSQRVDEDRQGLLQGVIASLNSVAAILGPVLMTPLFRIVADEKGAFLPGAPFLVASMIMLALIPVLRAQIKRAG
ncbi:MAG: MFS transporter [Maritimibacter sp.]